MPVFIKMKSYFIALNSSLTENKWIRISISFLIFLVLLYLIKSCLPWSGDTSTVFRIARDSTWYPLSFAGKEKNVLGFSDDLMLAIAKKKNIHIQLVVAPPNDLLDKLDDRNVEGIFTSMIPDSMLREKYEFSHIYYNLGVVLIVSVNSQVKGLHDMTGKYLGITRGSPVMFNVGNYPALKLIPYDSSVTMLDDIYNDKVDGALLNQLAAYNFVTGYYKNRLQIVTSPLTQEGLRLVTLNGKNQSQLIEAFNLGLEEMKNDGTYKMLLQKWDLYDPYVQ